MPYDRHDRTHVLDDSRAYDVGLSDDAGGGNPLGFAIKVAYAPTQFEVSRLDDYVKYTLFGIKTPETCPKCGAKPPYKSLQIRPVRNSFASLPSAWPHSRQHAFLSHSCIHSRRCACAGGLRSAARLEERFSVRA